MTRTEERLKAALAQTAGLVREEELRPLVVPRRKPRHWLRVMAPAAAAAAVVAALAVDAAVGQLAGAPPAAHRPKAAPAVRTGGHPHYLAFDSAAGTVYVSTGTSRGLAMIDTATCNASATGGCATATSVPTGGIAAGVAVDEQTQTVYAINQAPRPTLAVINAATCNAATRRGCRATPTLVPLPGPPNVIAVNPRTSTVYVTYVRSNRITVINGAACRGSDTSGCGSAAVTVPDALPAKWYSWVTVDPATNTVYLAADGEMAVIDGRTCGSAGVSGCPHAVAVTAVDGLPEAATADASTGTLYVGSPWSGGLTVIDERACNALVTAGEVVLLGNGGPGDEYRVPGHWR